MNMSCRGYFCDQHEGDGTVALKRLWSLNAALKQLAEGRTMNWSGRVLLSDEDVEDGALPREAVLAAAAGAWPAIALNITFATGQVTDEDLAPIEAEFGLQLIGEFSQGGPGGVAT